MWPVKPLQVSDAWVSGTLFGRRDYPALVEGSDKVQGELWRFAEPQMETVLLALDQIECTNQPGLPDLYRRVVSPAHCNNEIVRAFTYLYATSPADDGFERIDAGADGFVSWAQA